MGDSMRAARHVIRELRSHSSEGGLSPRPSARSPLLTSLLQNSSSVREEDPSPFQEAAEEGRVSRASSGRPGAGRAGQQPSGLQLPGSANGGVHKRSGKDLWNVARVRLQAVHFANQELQTVAARTRHAQLAPPTFPLREESQPAPGWFAPVNDMRMLWGSISSSYVSLLLLAVPLGLAAEPLGWGPVAVFVLNFVALVPLALLLGEITEDLATRFGQNIGGLLNATFGNAVELILSLAALSKGLFSVVAMSLIGSILSNLLLVLGCCFLFGGLKYREQSFSALATKTSSSLLFMATIGILIPTASSNLYSHKAMTEADDLLLSRGTAVVLALVYIAYLYFQLKTHHTEFAGEEEGDEEPNLSLSGSLACLLGITVVVALCSELLTGAIEAVSHGTGVSQDFLGLVVLPIAGNACEHITAVFVAVKDKMDLAIGIALGSSIQIALFVVPVVVLVGWAIGQPMSLNFDPFATLVLTFAVIHAYSVSADARSNWLMGLQLVATYVLVGMCFFFVHTKGQHGEAGL